MLDLAAITIPNAPAVNSDMIASFSGTPLSSHIEIRQPGIIPQEPAVGAATILPMAALHPDTDRALDMAPARKGPQSDFPLSAYSLIRKPSPPVSPDIDLKSFFRKGFLKQYKVCFDGFSCDVVLGLELGGDNSSALFDSDFYLA